ncbi:phage minor capsid protein [Streptomyces nigrescens]
MPVSPELVEDLSASVRNLYTDAEERLLGIMARQLAAGYEAPGWAQRKLAAIQPLRRAAQAVVDELSRAVTLEVFDVVAEAYNRGHRAAVAELGALSDGARRLVNEITPNAQAVDRLAHESVEVVTATHRGILRAIVDGFRDVVARVTSTPLLGTGTRRQATQDAMRQFADRGISGFTDRAGRRWQLTSYAEMAVRTSTARAAVEAHTRALTEAGLDLVIVSDAPRECPLCRPWEGKLLAIGGPDGRRTVVVEHAVEDGRMLRVVVQGTLDEARRAGLQHPNCRHSVSAYIPGVSSLIPPMRSDGKSYEAGQRQRAIERNIRKHKKRAAAAVTPEAKKAAEAKVRTWQGAMREHLVEHPQLRRNRVREQLGAGNLPPARTEAPQAAVEAARLRTGDEHTPGEMSEQQLADAIGSSLPDERDLDRAAAELDRRDEQALLDRIRPGGQLADDLSGFSDEVLGWAVLYARADEAERLAAEVDRRHPVQLPPAAASRGTEGQLDDAVAIDQTLAPLPSPAAWGWLALDEPDRFAGMSDSERWIAEREAEQEAARGAYTRAQIREMYREHVYRQWLAAEDWCRGYLLTRRAQHEGIDPESLFSGPAHVAYARASEELKRYWSEVEPRLTLAEFTEQITGQRSTAAERARQARGDQENRQ